MSEFEHRPLDEDFKTHQKTEAPTTLDMAYLKEDLADIVKAEGPEVVADALTQVVTARARPQELLGWIDDLRDPDRKAPEPEVPEGFMHDFVADTEMAGGSLEVPGGSGDDAPFAAKPEDSGAGGDDDADYFFPTTRRRRLGEDDEDESPSDENKAAPPAVKVPTAKTTKKR